MYTENVNFGVKDIMWTLLHILLTDFMKDEIVCKNLPLNFTGLFYLYNKFSAFCYTFISIYYKALNIMYARICC